MADTRTDRRVRKTRKLLQDALISLIAEKGFEAVSVQELLDRANVGRSTFYLHFENKEELLHSCFEEYNQQFSRHNAEMLRNGCLENDHYITGFFRFVAQNHGFFKAMIGEHGVPMFNMGIYDYALGYYGGMTKNAAAGEKQNPVKTDLLTHHLASAFAGILKWWVDKNMPCAAEELGQYVLRQTTATIRQALSI